MGHEIGSLIGDYRLIKAIGSGACGEVFQAEHTITRRVEAIKLLARRTPGTEDEEQSLLREIEIQASLQHPNIAAVHNAFRVPDGLALVMELIEGEPLSAILDRDGVPLCDGTRYVLVTLDALTYAHERRVVHRDVKPANIVITPRGSVKLTDFGLARSLDDGQAANSGIPAGSPYYMSPEQIVGSPADARSDCYSVGVILYELAAGRKPFQGDTAFEVMLQHREAAPVPPISIDPQIGTELSTVILKALEKDPARRFQSAAEFRRSLEHALVHCPAMRERAGRGASGKWIAAAALAGLACTSAALLPSLRRKPVVPPPAPVVQMAPPPAIPAAAPPPVDPPADPEPQPVIASDTVPPAKAARRTSQVRAHVTAANANQLIISPAPDPKPQAEAPVDPPVIPPALPEVSPIDAVIPHQPEAAPPPKEATAEPAKHPGILRRALGHLARPFSSRKPDKPDKP